MGKIYFVYMYMYYILVVVVVIVVAVVVVVVVVLFAGFITQKGRNVLKEWKKCVEQSYE